MGNLLWRTRWRLHYWFSNRFKWSFICFRYFSSSNNISTINTNTPSHSNADSFLIKFDSVEIEFGVLILVKTWLCVFLGIDSNDNLYSFGWTLSLSNISTPGVFQEVYNDSFWATFNNGCIFKFNSNGDKIGEPIFFRNYKRICFKKMAKYILLA
jgi:hypothetical protein